MKKLLKPKKCKVCNEQYNPVSSIAKVCSVKCAHIFREQEKVRKAEKEERLEQKRVNERLDELKTLPQLIKECQQVFNKFIRLRDWGKPCISCGTPHTGAANSFDAGHYRSVGSSPEVRFDPRNVHGQCKHCNRYKFDSSVYRANLIAKIGVDQVEALEAEKTAKNYTRQDIRALIITYKQKCKELERERS